MIGSSYSSLFFQRNFEREGKYRAYRSERMRKTLSPECGEKNFCGNKSHGFKKLNGYDISAEILAYRQHLLQILRPGTFCFREKMRSEDCHFWIRTLHLQLTNGSGKVRISSERYDSRPKRKRGFSGKYHPRTIRDIFFRHLSRY